MKKKMIVMLFTVMTMIMVFQGSLFAETENKPLTLSGFIDVVFTQRFGDSAQDSALGKGQSGLYLMGMNLDGKYGYFGYHATVLLTGGETPLNSTFSTTNNQRFFGSYDSAVWAEEAYIFIELPVGKDSKIKIGSVYTPFGLQGDNSWYLQLHYYAGLSLDADYGWLADFNFDLDSDLVDFRVAVGWYFQDDHKNGSLNGSSGTLTTSYGVSDVSIEGDPNTEETDKFALRLAPTFTFDNHLLTVGVSAFFGNVNSNGNDSTQYVVGFDLDYLVKFDWFSLRFFGEYVIASRNNSKVQFSGFNQSPNSNANSGDNKNYDLFIVGLTFGFEIGNEWFNSIDIHMNYGEINRDNGFASGATSNLFIFGTAMGITDKFAITLEYAVGFYDKGTSVSADNLIANDFIIDFFYEF